VVRPQTTVQILRCFNLGRYTARMVEGRLETDGPQPLAGPLPASIKARREELVGFLDEWCDGAWPPAPGSGLREVQRTLGCGPAGALDAVEAELEGDRVTRTGIEPWDTEWAAEKAANALRYLGRNFPECLENTAVLEPHEEAANEAAMRGDEVAYLEALRAYCRAGRDEALRIRRGAA
jgi:hypothetical protein